MSGVVREIRFGPRRVIEHIMIEPDAVGETRPVEHLPEVGRRGGMDQRLVTLAGYNRPYNDLMIPAWFSRNRANSIPKGKILISQWKMMCSSDR